MKKPNLYIEYFQDGAPVKRGPYFTASFDGCGLVVGQNWITYRVQTADLHFERITVPAYHSISTT